jgi:hypothetical protein
MGIVGRMGIAACAAMVLVGLLGCDQGKKPEGSTPQQQTAQKPAQGTGDSGTTAPKVDPVKTELPETSAVAKALKDAKAEGKKAVVFFERKGEGLEEMAAAFKTAQSNCAKDAVFLSVSADDPKEAEAVKKFQVDAVSKPVIFVLFGDGLILTGFTEPPKPGEIDGIIASAKIVEFAEAMATKGIVIVIIGPKDAEDLAAAFSEANAYIENLIDMKGFVITVELPAPQSEQGFVVGMGVDPQVKETVTCIAAKGAPAGKLNGKITKADIKKIVDAACGPGCTT